MYLLRVMLPDQPGTLGTVASALGHSGADIVAVDVVERLPDGQAVDDFVVELPLGGRADELVSACQSVDGVRVVWLSRYDTGGRLRRDLEAVEAMTERPRKAKQLLVELAPGVFRADWALLLRESGPGEEPWAAVATGGAPDLPAGGIPWAPVEKPVVLDIPEEWEAKGWRHVAAAAAPVNGSGDVLVIGRAGGPEFLGSELARLGHLAGLASTIERSVGS